VKTNYYYQYGTVAETNIFKKRIAWTQNTIVKKTDKTYQKDPAACERCIDALKHEILSIQRCSFAKILHYWFCVHLT
jgi:hypothetical protein